MEAVVLPDGNYYLPSTGEIIPADMVRRIANDYDRLAKVAEEQPPTLDPRRAVLRQSFVIGFDEQIFGANEQVP